MPVYSFSFCFFLVYFDGSEFSTWTTTHADLTKDLTMTSALLWILSLKLLLQIEFVIEWSFSNCYYQRVSKERIDNHTLVDILCSIQ